LFAATVIPLLAEAMHLHSKPLGDDQQYRAARKIKGWIERLLLRIWGVANNAFRWPTTGSFKPCFPLRLAARKSGQQQCPEGG
jgi:hypothetical protein